MITPLLQNETTAHNGTSSFSESAAREVSWPSACWPVIACMIGVMVQDTGRVLGAPFALSAALRASPLTCILDTLMMIVHFIDLLTNKYSVSSAARQVWFARFQPGDESVVSKGPAIPHYEPHLDRFVSRNWRLNITGFMIGTVPQVLKVFAMRGVPLTTALTSAYFVAFLVPELFRLIAERSNNIGLPPIRIVVHSTSRTYRLEGAILYVSTAFSLFLCHSWTVFILVDHKSHVFVRTLLLFTFFTSVAFPLSLCFAFILQPKRQVWIKELPAASYMGAMVLYGITIFCFNIIFEPLFLVAWFGYSVFPSPLLTSNPPRWIRLFECSSIPYLFISAGYGQFLGLYSLLCALISRSSWWTILQRSLELKRFFGNLLPLYFVFHTLCAFFYFYSSQWNSHGTSKPAWTDYLG